MSDYAESQPISVSELREEVLRRFEGRDYDPGGPMRFAWHVKHAWLVEPLTGPIASRVDWIISTKAKREIAIRLSRLRPVIGVLPTRFVKAATAWVEADKAWDDADEAVDEASKALVEAQKALGEARKAVDEAWKTVIAGYQRCYEAGKAVDEAGRAWNDAEEVWHKARKAWNEARQACLVDLEALHAIECPDCPWDGKTLVFPPKGA